jgi:hypothetical protein
MYIEALPFLTRPTFDRDEVELSVELTLERRMDGQLLATRGDVVQPVYVRRCFPWSRPLSYISLRDEDDNEVALVRDVNDLDAASGLVLQDALAEAGFVLEIRRIVAIDEEVEIRNWKVETRQGTRTFQTRLDDWPRQLPGGGVLIPDVGGDLYRVADPAALDEASRKLLWAYVD